MKKAFLVKYGEIAIKGKNRYIFEDQLLSRISNHIVPYGDFKVKKEQGRVFIDPQTEDYDEEDVIQAIQKVFGILYVGPVWVFEDDHMDTIVNQVLAYMEEEYDSYDFTFKVETRRANKKYPLNSMEISRDVGGKVLEAYPSLKVDVKNPDEKIWIEIRNQVYVYSRMEKGLGGMPVGSNGKGMLMLSGGIDSPVAGYMISRRGLQLDAVYFDAPPYTSPRAKEKVVELARLLSEYTGKINLHIVPFTEIQLAIYDQCPHEELTIIMRRIMMRISEHFAEKMGAKALITGESIGQVASQTVESLAATNAVCKLPVFRPLIGFDKQDIIDVSHEIGTYETSILPYEDCCTVFVAKHPVTRPVLAKMANSEAGIKGLDALMEKAIEDTEQRRIRPSYFDFMA